MLKLPILTAGTRTWEYPQAKGEPIVQVLDIAIIEFAGGCCVEVPLDDIPYDLRDMDEVRGLIEYMEQEGMTSLREITSASTVVKEKYDAIELNTSILKTTSEVPK